MSRTTRRVLRTELMRGTAPIVAVTLAVVGAALLFTLIERWAGRWEPLAQNLRFVVYMLIPFAVTAGAWQAGRESRRKVGELLSSTPRPAAQPVVVAWVTVTVGTFAGLFLAWLPGAFVVAPVATYGGWGWWWTLGVAFAGIAMGSALGVAAGRLIAGRLVAPLSGLVVFVGIGMLTAMSTSLVSPEGMSDPHGWALLSPTQNSTSSGVERLESGVQLLQVLWLAALAAVLLVLASAQRTWLALVPASMAMAAAVFLVGGSAEDRWRVDPMARELVCTGDDGAEVCLTRVNAFLLDDIAGPVRAQLARWEGVDDGFVRAADRSSIDDDAPVPDGTATLDLERLASWDGGLSDQTSVEYLVAQAAEEVNTRNCAPIVENATPEDLYRLRIWEVSETAFFWAVGELNPVGVEPGEEVPFQVLLGKSETEQKDWMGRYMRASRSCDAETFAELMEELK